MVIISREEGICDLFGVDSNEENIKIYSERLGSGDLDVCYLDGDPTQPFAMSNAMISRYPGKYKRYTSLLHIYDQLGDLTIQDN